MRASVFIATSLDGFIARADGGLDWLPMPEGDGFGYDEFVASVDAMVIGRKTFETVQHFGGWPYGTKPVVVLSTTMAPVPLPEGAVCEWMAGTPEEIAQRLAERGWTDVYVDGGVTIQGFLRAGLVRRLILTRIPILLGTGIPLFGALPRDVQLQHVATRSFPNGMVHSEYVVVG